MAEKNYNDTIRQYERDRLQVINRYKNDRQCNRVCRQTPQKLGNDK